MSIALKFENDDVVWLDAVTSYSESLSGRVTEHPVEDGTVISDSVIKDPANFSLNAVVSNADFCFNRPIDIILSPFVKNTANIEAARLNGNKPKSITKYLPDSLSSFFPVDIPEVVTSTTINDFASTVRTRITEAFDKGESITVVEYDNGEVKRSIPDLYLTSLTFNETVETGDALEVSMSIRKVVKVVLSSAVVGAVKLRKSYGDNAGGKTGSTTEDVSADKTTEETATTKDMDESLIYKGVIKPFVHGG